MFPGVIVKLGERELEVPPLSLGQIKRLSKEVGTLQVLRPGDAIDPGMLDMFLSVVHAALSRNYTDVTKEWLEDVVDLGNMVEVVNAVMNVSGFVQGVQRTTGEQASRLTGTGSTPILSPVLGGPGNT